MTDQPLPTWVSKRDGRVVPFEADKISRALFAGTESLGRPDAFTARELTDGILHFLSGEAEGSILPTSQVADLVVKIVRELGHPELSRAFEEFARHRVRGAARIEGPTPIPEPRSPLDPRSSILDPRALARQVSGAYLHDYSLREVFTRDLVAAHTDGLLTLTGLEAPFELAGCVLPSPRSSAKGLVEALEEARGLAGQFVSVDGPEYGLSLSASSGEETARHSRELGIGLRATGLRAVINLNCTAPPSWADDLAEGPLFGERRQIQAAHSAFPLLDTLVPDLLRPASGQVQVRIDWHLGERDFAPEGGVNLAHVARLAAEALAVAFVFDRPRRPVALAEGIDRGHPAVLVAVGLHLLRLAQQPALQGDPKQFLEKLGSLARLALSAAVQKRDFLRRHSRSRPAFLLDRARLVVVPVGLDAVVRHLFGRNLCEGGAGLEFARELIQRLRQVLEKDGQACHLDTCLDSGADFLVDEFKEEASADPIPSARAAGLTAWDPEASLKNQLRVAGFLHGAAEMGTAAVLVSEGRALSPEQIVDLLRYAWQQTQVVRLRFLRFRQHEHQLVAPWENSGQ